MTEDNDDKNYCQETRTKKYINFAVLKSTATTTQWAVLFSQKTVNDHIIQLF